MSAIWPVIARLIESNTYADPVRRGDAIERAVEDLTFLLGTTRRNLHRTRVWLRDQERAARAAEKARKARVPPVAVVG